MQDDQDCGMIETVHGENGLNLHFRFIGQLAGRQFVVNVQFPTAREDTGERLMPIEYDFLIAKIMGFSNRQNGGCAESGFALAHPDRRDRPRYGTLPCPNKAIGSCILTHIFGQAEAPRLRAFATALTQDWIAFVSKAH